MKERYFRNEYGEIWLENGIIHTQHNLSFCNIRIAQILVAGRLKISDGISRPLLGDFTKCLSVDAEVRKYLLEGDSMKFILAGALLIDNPISRFMGNVFLKINRPLVPTQLFTDKKKALKWLEQFKELN